MAAMKLFFCLTNFIFFLLAHGGDYQNLEHVTTIANSTLSVMIPEVCDALFRALQPRVMKWPENENDWKYIAAKFEEKTFYPLCIGKILIILLNTGGNQNDTNTENKRYNMIP